MNQPATVTSESSAFPAGTFTPHPMRASVGRMIAAQARIESLLFLRHGEQQLLSIVIPLGMLIALSQFNFLDLGDPLAIALPLSLAISAMSAGFTGQAIAVAFDRRYGALKRIGASGVPAWTIIAGKVVAVAVVNVVQTLLLAGTALVLGWRPGPLSALTALVLLVIGVAAFTALGLLLGGTMSSEIVLALANLIWFIFSGLAGYSALIVGQDGIGVLPHWLQLIPSVALADGMVIALNGGWSWMCCVVLLVWGAAAAAIATRRFRFES